MKSILIVGGGFAGLMAAYELSKHKYTVTIIEAKDRLGGRAHTVTNVFSRPVELGAEFIHGDLPETLSLLKESGIPYYRINDEMFYLNSGKFLKQDAFFKHWNTLMHQMKALKEDVPLDEFLNNYFNEDEYKDLRIAVKDFAGGFDLADTSTASTKSLYSEWSNEMENQYRLNNGYTSLVNYLEDKCKENGCIIEKNCCAKKINWCENKVSVLTMCSRIFNAENIILAVPLSVLQADENSGNYLEFTPAIPAHIDAARNIGYGDVIKVLLEFSDNFWNAAKSNAGFFLTNEIIPTWWSQLPEENNILSGWVGGEKATSLKLKTEDRILEIALQSLSNAFAISMNDLKIKLQHYFIANWSTEPDINGGYSFNTIKSVEAKKMLHQPINNTIYFTGEALYEGTPGGTVEAALCSAKNTVERLLKANYHTL